MFRHSSYALTLGLLLFGSIGAHAQVTYNYTGQDMTGTMSGPDTFVADYLQISGWVVLAQALNPNQANQTVIPVSYKFNNSSVLDSSPNFATVTATFSTANGVITAWNFNLFRQGGSGAQVNMVLSNAGDSMDAGENSGDCQFIPEKCNSWDVSNKLAGAWTVTQPDPLIAQLAAAQAQVASLTVKANSYAMGYLAANDIVTELEAYIVQERLAVYWLNVQVAKCRANKGVC